MFVTAQVLNVRGGPGTGFPVVRKLRHGADIQLLEERDGWVRIGGNEWVAKTYLELLPLKAPKGVLEIMKTFGAPASPSCYSGRCMLPAPLKIGWEQEKTIGAFACHRLLSDRFQEVFQRIHSEGFWEDLRTFDGCFNDRDMKGSKTRRSTHAWGIAVDLNAAENPLGEDGSLSKDVVRIFLEEGFIWGGHFEKRRDPMHFQFASGY